MKLRNLPWEAVGELTFQVSHSTFAFSPFTLHNTTLLKQPSTLQSNFKMVSERAIKLTLTPLLVLSFLASIVTLAISASLESESCTFLAHLQHCLCRECPSSKRLLFTQLTFC